MVRLGSLLLLVAALAAVAPSAANDAAEKAGTEVAAAVAEPAVAAGKQVTIKHDHTTREGNGDNLPYKGLDYLGMGYDLVKGNPHGDPDSMMDPGFRVPAVELTWDQNVISRDVRDLQPVEGWAYPETACRRSLTSKQQSTMSEYESSLSVEASVHGEVEGVACSAAFEASAGFDSFAKEVAETDSERIEMTSYCFTSVAGLREDAAAVLKPTVYLKEVASKLKPVANTKCHHDFERCVHLTNRGKTMTVIKKDLVLPAHGVQPDHSAAEYTIASVAFNPKERPKDGAFSWDPMFQTVFHQETGRLLGVVPDDTSATLYKLELKDGWEPDQLQTKKGYKSSSWLNK